MSVTKAALLSENQYLRQRLATYERDQTGTVREIVERALRSAVTAEPPPIDAEALLWQMTDAVLEALSGRIVIFPAVPTGDIEP